jgi:hypothetical protein
MRLLPLALLLAQLPAGVPQGIDAERDFMRRCVEEKPKLDCIRESLIIFRKSEPLENGEIVTGKSERLQIRVSGDRWLRHGWDGLDSGTKDLGLMNETISFLDFEIRDPTAPSPTESVLVAELGVMIEDMFIKLARYQVSPQFLGEPAFIEKVLPSGNWLKLASRCYAFAGTTNCAYVGVAEGKNSSRGLTAHSTGTAHPMIGEMIESIQLR